MLRTFGAREQRIRRCRPAPRPHARRLAVEALEPRRLLAPLSMSDADLLMIALLNRARADPAAEAARYGIDLNDGLAPGTISSAPKPPLAPDPTLISLAELHTQWMLDNHVFQHEGQGGETLGSRAHQVNYAYTLIGENIAYIGLLAAESPTDATVAALHANLFRSPGHRQNMLQTEFVEVGVGIRVGLFLPATAPTYATVVTVDFGTREGNHYLTGVAYADPAVSGNFYSQGEGLDQVSITAHDVAQGTDYTTSTASAGSYALQVPPGTYDLHAEGGALIRPLDHKGVVLGTQNVQVDFLVSGVAPPVAAEDAGLCLRDGVTQVEVLANDTGAGGFSPDTVQVVSPPQHGTTAIDPATGIVTYTPNHGFLGVDRFTYSVADVQGQVSAPARVTMTVVDLGVSPWRNPVLAEDVNGDGLVTPLDALVLINTINSSGSHALDPPSANGAFPLPYLDVSGDNTLSPLDVLQVINHINSQSAAAGEAGPPALAPARLPAGDELFRRDPLEWLWMDEPEVSV